MAKVRHKKPESIWLFDFPSLESLDDCPQWLVLLSERDINIIWQATLNIDRFRSRIFTDVSGENYTIVNLDQFGQFKEWVSDMNVNMGDFMACNELLERIAVALESGVGMSGCCGGIEGVSGGSSGTGMENAPPSTTEDTEESHSGPPPTGFASWEEFDEEKCNWATYIVEQMMVDVLTMGSVNVGVQSATALAGVLVTLLVTPVGWVILLEIAVIMIAATLTVGFYSLIHTHLETYKDEYICSLLNGTSTDASITNFSSAVDVQISDDSAFNALTGYWAGSILKSLNTVDSVNRMYDKQAFIPPTADCSACLGDILAYVDAVPCAPITDPSAGHFFEGMPVEVQACEGNFFGDIRAGMVFVSNPAASTIDRKFTLISNSGIATLYLQPYYAGSPGSGISLSSGAATGYVIECNQLVICHPTPSTTTPFTVTAKAEELP
jgi:hypothetical protein